MDFKVIFRTYRKRMLIEALIKALLIGITVAAGTVFLYSLGSHIHTARTYYSVSVTDTDTATVANTGTDTATTANAVTVVAIAVSVTAVTTLLLVLTVYRPTDKRVAHRLDSLGLEERILTMLELQNETTPIAQLQRRDALEHLKQVSPRDLRLRISRTLCMICLTAVILATVMLALPADIFVRSDPEAEEAMRREQIINTLIANLREVIDAAPNGSQTRKQLLETVDGLASKLDAEDTVLTNIAAISRTADEIDEILLPVIAEAEAVEAMEEEFAQTLMYDDAESAGTENSPDIDNPDTAGPEAGQSAADTDSDGADTTGPETEQPAAATGGDNPDAAGPETAGDVTASAAIYTEPEALTQARDYRIAMETERDELIRLLEEARDELLGNKNFDDVVNNAPGSDTPDSTQENEEGDMQGEDGEPGEGEPEDGTGEGEGEGDGDGEGGLGIMTEGFYDPDSGATTYGEVYAIYYAEYLRQLENGEVSEELQRIMDSYFEILGTDYGG